MATHAGGCHCGAVRFEVEAQIDRLTLCNCSICTKKGALHHRVAPAQFRLLSGAEALTSYRFGSRVAEHLFCRHCGIHPFAHPRSAPELFVVNLRCLDEAARVIANAEIVAFDGQNWETAVAALR